MSCPHRHAWIFLLVALPGCSITGTWRTVAVDCSGPAGPGAPDFVIETITFAENRQFTATTVGPGRTTTTGTYRHSGSRLTLEPFGGEPTTYRARLRQAELLLSAAMAEHRLSVTLHRTFRALTTRAHVASDHLYTW